MMLHQKRSGRLARLKHLVALPLLAGMLCLSTLGFTKDYTLLDLAPVKTDTTKLPPPPPPAPPVQKPRIKNIPPPPPPVIATTKKGYKYSQDGYLVKGKTDFRVIITEKDGTEHDYFKSKATAADLKLLNDKYGYTFPSLKIYDKLPPPPPMAPIPAPKVKGPNVEIVIDAPEAVPTVKADTTPQNPLDVFYKYVAQHVRYPTVARNNNVQGKVFVIFNINEDRSITNVWIARGLTEETNNEVVRVIKNYQASPAFKTDVNYTIPVSFALQGQDGSYLDSKSTMPKADAPKVNETYKKTGFKNYALSEVVVVGFPAKN